jgi:hypothetical protein
MQMLVSILTILTALVTAGATIALWRVTKVLADETKRMASATAQPQVVVNIESNDWSYIHADMHVTNTGNSTAFDIGIEFDPPLIVELDNSQSTAAVPFKNISVLKPGQSLASWIGRMSSYLDSTFVVKVSWRSTPNSPIESYSYTLDMRMYNDVNRLGSGDPLIQIANSAKSIKEDVHRVTLSGKIRVDS